MPSGLSKAYLIQWRCKRSSKVPRLISLMLQMVILSSILAAMFSLAVIQIYSMNQLWPFSPSNAAGMPISSGQCTCRADFVANNSTSIESISHIGLPSIFYGVCMYFH